MDVRAPAGAELPALRGVSRSHRMRARMLIKFEGKVATGDSYRVSYGDDRNGSLWIGEHDIVEEVESAKWNGPVTCAVYGGSLLGDTAWSGALRIQQGWGYSEWTPMDSDELFVGPHNLLKIIGEMEGEDVTVWFADEPINVLAGVVVAR